MDVLVGRQILLLNTYTTNSPHPSQHRPKAQSHGLIPHSYTHLGRVETSLTAAMMLDQQLTTAFQTGLRHSLDDSDHDALSDLSEK